MCTGPASQEAVLAKMEANKAGEAGLIQVQVIVQYRIVYYSILYYKLVCYSIA